MALMSGATGRLWRYNYRILIGTGYWIVVLPLAASQVVTLWMMALSSDFSQAAATNIAEMMTPILGAFFVAHSLAPEYRGGVGAVLACKPVSLHRVVTMRAGLAMIAALALSAVTLTVCSVGLKPIDVPGPLLAAIPSLWFLSMVALTFATLFRNALAGFATAAALWAVDLTLGYSVHPLLSLQGLSASQGQEALGFMWPMSKVILSVVGFVLLLVHGRLIRRLYQMSDRSNVMRVVASTGALLFIYCATGAMTLVGYGWMNRGRMQVADVVWLQRQLKAYGPVPVAKLFGPAFSIYVAETPPLEADRARTYRRTQLESALKRWPKSIWADGIAFALGREQENYDKEASTEAYVKVADAYGSSPFAPKALSQILRMEDAVPAPHRLRAARRLIADYPRSPEVDIAAGALQEQHPAQVSASELAAAAAVAAEGGSPFRRPLWLMVAADLKKSEGDLAAAAELAAKARAAGLALREAEAQKDSAMPDAAINRYRGDIDAAIRDADALLKTVDQPVAK
ncbi:MAG: tetratricopeptide repeat protein [Actinomycetota bacterium]